MTAPDITIRRLDGSGLSADRTEQVDAIFFEASGRTGFASPEERAAFRERWLGRYLHTGADILLLAETGSGVVAGYLVGAVTDPAEQDRFADIDYFRGVFRALCRRYPAHLHINLAPGFRSGGIGGRLVAAFAEHAAAAGAPGFHVVTGRASRNVAFYRRCGLAEVGGTCWNGRDVVFLAKALESCQTP
jgi:GNAT superfamily N-acetyltransferase